MRWLAEKTGRRKKRETLTEAYEVRAFKDEDEKEQGPWIEIRAEVPHPEPGELQIAKDRVRGHGEQRIVPDDCQFGDNDMCYVEA